MEQQDGIAKPPASTGSGNARAYFAWGALALMVISLALPFVQLAFVGSQNLFGMNDGTTYWFLGAAVIGGIAIFFNRYRLLAIPGVLVLGTTLAYVYHFNAIKHDAANAFTSLETVFLSTFKLQYGIAVVLVAGAAIVTASFMTRDAATLPELFAVNRHALISGAVVLAVLFLLVALAPTFLAAG